MSCTEFNELLFDYIDGELDDSQKKGFEEHINACSSCKKELTAYQKMIDSVHALKPEKLPEGYCKKLNTRLKAARVDVVRKKRIYFTKYVGIAAAFILVVFAFNFMLGNFGLSSKNARDSSMMDEEKKDFDFSMNNAGITDRNESISPQSSDQEITSDDMMDSNRNPKLFASGVMAQQSKIIKSGRLIVEIIKFDEFVERLNQEIRDKNGYIEYSDVSVRNRTESKSYRYANFNLRVPQEIFDDFIKFISENSDVNSKYISENDVTKDYYDKQNILTNLEIQENRLRELYEKAENITDILAIENEIRRIRTEIDAYNIDLSDIDDRVNMSTIELSVIEVDSKDLNIRAEDGLWTRAKKGFVITVNRIINSAQTLVVWFISYILIIVPVVVILTILCIRIKRKRKNMQ